MSKHTPGPWEVIDGFYPSVKEIKGPSFTITAVMLATDLTQKDYKNRHADLHLIAAAPDLLNALEQLVAVKDYSDRIWGATFDWDAARAAIAKAKGEV